LVVIVACSVPFSHVRRDRPQRCGNSSTMALCVVAEHGRFTFGVASRMRSPPVPKAGGSLGETPPIRRSRAAPGRCRDGASHCASIRACWPSRCGSFWQLRSFTDLTDGNAQVRHRLKEVANRRRHRETGNLDVRVYRAARVKLPASGLQATRQPTLIERYTPGCTGSHRKYPPFM